MASQENITGRVAPLDENEEVMRALLIHETKSGTGSRGAVVSKPTIPAANASDSDSDTSESDEDSPPQAPVHNAAAALRPGRQAEEEDEDDEFEEVGDDPVVMVGGKPFAYREVSQRPELVEQMSAQEKDAYIEMGQTLFQDMYF